MNPFANGTYEHWAWREPLTGGKAMTQREKMLEEALRAHQPELHGSYPNTILRCSCGWGRWNEQGWIAHMKAALAAPADAPAQDVERAIKWLRAQAENQRFVGDFRPDHATSLAAEFQRARIAAANEAKREVWAYVKAFMEKQAGHSFPDDGSTFEDWMRDALGAAANGALEALQSVESIVEFYLEREIEAPANHQEFAREAQQKLMKFSAAIRALKGKL